MADKFKCEVDGCGAEFDTENQLRGHMMHHKREPKKEEKRNTRVDRKKRVPLGVPRAKMTVSDTPPDKVRRWVNDHPGRIQRAQSGGYEFVRDDSVSVGDNVEDGNTDMGSRISMVVGKDEAGNPLRAYLMEIDKDLYEEDQQEKLKIVDRIDSAIKGGTNQNTLGEKGYIPESGISYNP